MKKKRKDKKINIFWHEIFKAQDFIKVLVSLLILSVILLITFFLTDSFKFDSLLEVKTFVAVLSAFILNFGTSAIFTAYKKHKEDENKLTTKYDDLVRSYSKNTTMVTYKNATASTENLVKGRKKTKCMSKGEKDENDDKKIKIAKKDTTVSDYDHYTIPIADVIELKADTTDFNNANSRKLYERPKEISGMYSEIMAAHSASSTYNQLMIRCDKITKKVKRVKNKENNTIEKKKITYFHVSKTTYNDSLSTNRALDYSVKGTTVRELLAYGPYLHPLEDSKLSNHIGYNGYVETADEKIIFIFRGKHVSIAKSTLQSSIGASLKVKHACSANGYVTKESFIEAVKREIEDELRLKEIANYKEANVFKDLSFNNVLYFYRELVEGGKPQFMFYVKLPLDSNTIKAAYTKNLSKFKKRKSCSVDGFKMILVDKSKLKDIYVTPDGMTINGKFYKSMPTSTGTFALLMKHLDDTEAKERQ